MEHFKELSSTQIFNGISEADCQAMMHCFSTKFKVFLKNQPIIRQGENIEDLPIILKGTAIVEHVDTLGNISILMRLQLGDVYGIESAYAGESVFKDSLIASEKTLVMFMNKHRLITPCDNKCKRHEMVVKRLMQMLAMRNVELTEKLTHMSKKSIRDKLYSYFSQMSNQAGSPYFEIPFNKTELANYLSVDRSAMSTELSKMRQEGLIDYDKKEYRLIHKNNE